MVKISNRINKVIIQVSLMIIYFFPIDVLGIEPNHHSTNLRSCAKFVKEKKSKRAKQSLLITSTRANIHQTHASPPPLWICESHVRPQEGMQPLSRARLDTPPTHPLHRTMVSASRNLPGCCCRDGWRRRRVDGGSRYCPVLHGHLPLWLLLFL